MHPRQVAFEVSPVHALHVVVVDVEEAHAVMKAEMSAAVQAPSIWTGVTDAATWVVSMLDAGVGQTGPASTSPPLLDPEPLLLPELDPEELPELDPDDPPEPDPELLPLLDPLLEPDPPPLDPPLEPELPPLPEPDPLPPPLLDDESMQACVAASAQAVVSAQDAQSNVCPPSV
jgi:hypothetical protein